MKPLQRFAIPLVMLTITGSAMANDPKVLRQSIAEIREVCSAELAKFDARPRKADVANNAIPIGLNPTKPWPSADRQFQLRQMAAHKIVNGLDFDIMDREMRMVSLCIDSTRLFHIQGGLGNIEGAKADWNKFQATIERVSAQIAAEKGKSSDSGKSANPGENSTKSSPNAGSGRMSTDQIASCSEEIKRTQVESQGWPGNSNEVAARLGKFQKEMFEGRCAGHPEAQAYINGANRMLGYTPGTDNRGTASASTGSAKSNKRSNVPEANASNCLAPQKEGGVVNKCAFAIEYEYCVVQPKPGSWSASFDCQQGKSGSWQVGPNSRAIMQTAGMEVAFFGCRYGPTLSKPDGISPADFRYNPNGLPSGRCREWGAP